MSADGFKEVDITVDPPRILFEWIGIENLPLKESVIHRPVEKIKEACEKNWDIQYVFHQGLCSCVNKCDSHLNSVDKFADGDYLLSVSSFQEGDGYKQRFYAATTRDIC